MKNMKLIPMMPITFHICYDAIISLKLFPWSVPWSPSGRLTKFCAGILSGWLCNHSSSPISDQIILCRIVAATGIFTWFLILWNVPTLRMGMRFLRTPEVLSTWFLNIAWRWLNSSLYFWGLRWPWSYSFRWYLTPWYGAKKEEVLAYRPSTK